MHLLARGGSQRPPVRAPRESSHRKRHLRAYQQPDYALAKAALVVIHTEIEGLNRSAATSLLEGLDETLTLHRLGLLNTLGKNRTTTNGIGNLNSRLGKYTDRVKRWRHSDRRHPACPRRLSYSPFKNRSGSVLMQDPGRPVPYPRRYLSLILAATFQFPVVGNVAAQRVIYVDADAVGASDGASWVDAFVFLQDALAIALDGDEIWIANGLYRPDQGQRIQSGDREASFNIPDAVAMYGGFLGVESFRYERDVTIYKSILDGDLLGNDAGPIAYGNPLRQDNSYHVVQVRTSSGGQILDGFTISGGMANIRGYEYGSALEIRISDAVEGMTPVRINDCHFTDNYALQGTVHMSAYPRTQYPTVVINNSTISKNSAQTGAGLFVDIATIRVSNVRVVDNYARQESAIKANTATVYLEGSTIAYNVADRYGAIAITGDGQGSLIMWNSSIVGNTSVESGPGGLVLNGATFVSVNNIFSGNASPDTGGAIYVSDSKPFIVNNVFAHNVASLHGGGIATNTSDTHVSNSIFWDNAAPYDPDLHTGYRDTLYVSYSLLNSDLPQGAIDGGGIQSGDPLFVDADGIDNVPGSLDDDFRLWYTSPAINTGLNDALYNDILDIDGDNDFEEPWPSDFAGNTRVFGRRNGGHLVDMGVFEFAAPPVGTFVFMVAETSLLPSTGMDVYPVPASSTLTVTWNAPSASTAFLQLFDMTGRLVMTIHHGPIQNHEQVRMPVGDLSPGLYILRDQSTGISVPVVVAQ